MHPRPWTLALLTLFVPLPLLAATEVRVVTDAAWCRESHEAGRARYCEVREATIPAAGLVGVDARPNGGIDVRGGERGDVRLQVKIEATAATDAEARALAAEVKIETAGTVRAVGPRHERGRSWQASFRLETPRQARLRLDAVNGGVHLVGVAGDVELHTVNGGIRVEAAGGHVHGETVNGGVHVALSGSEWQGEGLDLRSTNGGVQIEVPPSYNAHLEAATVHGGVISDLPIAHGHHTGGRIQTDLGRGGKPVHVETSNGGLIVKR